MKTNKEAFTGYFVDRNGKPGQVAILRRGTNFDYRISPEEAARLLREHGEAALPFVVMCKEYGDDSDWVGMTEEDLNEKGEDRAGRFDEDYKTFETWADDKGAAYFTPCAEPKEEPEEKAADSCPKCGADYDKNIVVDYNAAEIIDGEERAPFTCMKCGKQGFQFRALVFDRLTDK